MTAFSDHCRFYPLRALAMRKLLFAALIASTATTLAASTTSLRGTTIVAGFEPQIEASGLPPGQQVRIHAVRMFNVWEQAPAGGWRPAPRPLHGWADFRADGDGRVRLWRDSPVAGTYAGIDGYGILWSGRSVQTGTPNPSLPSMLDLATMKDGDSLILMTMGNTILARQALVVADPPALRIVDVAQGRLNGTFAAPSNSGRHAALILLHGSEGGDRDAARALAVRFAGQGYAAFAFNYFAWDLKQLPGVPNAHVNRPGSAAPRSGSPKPTSRGSDYMAIQKERNMPNWRQFTCPGSAQSRPVSRQTWCGRDMDSATRAIAPPPRHCHRHNIRRSAGVAGRCPMCRSRETAAAIITIAISTRPSGSNITGRRAQR